MDLRPYRPIAPTIEPGTFGGYAPAMRRVQDECDEYKRVYYAETLAHGIVTGSAKELKTAMYDALVADIYIRYIKGRNGNGCQILVRRYTSGGCAIYYRRLSSAGGFDFVAHLLDGVPLWLPPGFVETDGPLDEEGCITKRMIWNGARPPIILTDHCGLDGVAKPSAFGADWRSLTLDSSELEQLGYVVL